MVSNNFRKEVRKEVWFKPLLITAIIVFTIGSILTWGENGESQAKLFDFFKLLPIWGIFIFVAIVAPILEESIFRYGIQYRKFGFYLYHSVLLAIVVFTATIPVSVAMSLLFGWILVRKIKSQNHINLSIIFSSLAFGLAHIGNIGDISLFTMACYIAVISSMGLCFMLIRLRWGFLYGILAHAIWNFTSVFLMITAYPQTIESHQENCTFHLEKESIWGSNHSSSIIETDTLKIENTRLYKIIKYQFDNQNLILSTKEDLNFVKYSGYILPKNLSIKELSKQLYFDIDTTKRKIMHYIISDTLTGNFFPIYKNHGPNSIKPLDKRGLVGFKCKSLIKQLAWKNKARVHIELPDSILNTKIDNFEYNNYTDFIDAMSLLSRKLEAKWYYDNYQKEEEIYILKPTLE